MLFGNNTVQSAESLASVDVGVDVGSVLSIGCSDSINLGKLTDYGRTVPVSFSCNIITNHSGGYTLFWKSQDPALLNLSGDRIEPYVPHTTGVPDIWRVAPESAVWGGHLGSQSSTIDKAVWGELDSYEGGKWLNVSTVNYSIAKRADETVLAGDNEYIYLGAEIGRLKEQPAGYYRTHITMTALAI